MAQASSSSEVIVDTICLSDDSDVEMTEMKQPTEERRISRRKKRKLVNFYCSDFELIIIQLLNVSQLIILDRRPTGFKGEYQKKGTESSNARKS